MTNYFETVGNLVAEGKTTGPNQGESWIHYTELAYSRMKRWNKIGRLLPEMKSKLESITSPQSWTVITEAWCGDAAHAFMFLEKMADVNPLITLHWKLRDENLELIDQYLTNGGRSIPKLIVKDENGQELYNWGPRPQFIQNKYLQLKTDNVPAAQISIEIQKMYNADKGETMQREILSLMK